jgi:hypothetical protein
MSPCFRTYYNWYMAFNERSPYPFNPARAGPAPATREPIFHFTFDDAGDVPINQITGEEATCVGDCVSGLHPLTYQTGRVGSRALSTSNGARMLMGPIAYSVTARFSVCAWLKSTRDMSPHTGWQTAIGRWGAGHGGVNIFHLGLEDDTFGEYAEVNGNLNFIGAPAGTMESGTWTHICEAVSSGTDGKKQMWVNGELVGEVANAGTPAYANREGTFNMVLGDKCESCANKWDGQIDDVKMWDVFITQDEAVAAYNA